MENDNIVFNLKRKMFYIWIIMYFALIYIYIIFKSIFPTKQCNDMLCVCTVN